MSILKTRFARLPWIAKVAVGAVALILVSSIAWLWVPRTSQEDPKGPPPDPTLTAAHQGIIDTLVTPIERAPNATPVAPKVRAIRTNSGVTTFLTIPLSRQDNTTNEQFIRDAKKQIATIINTLFSNDTSIQIISVTATYPRADGREVIVMSVFVPRKTWQSQGNMTEDNIDKLAQSFQLNKDFTP